MKQDLNCGVYIYTYARTEEEAIQQADWICEKVKDYKLELPIVFDWESWTSFAKAKVSFYGINKVAKTFIERVESHGYQGALYGSKNYLEKAWYADEFENIWLAHYTSKTSYEGKYKYWQMTENGKIDGINGNVDIDIWYK